MEARETFNNVAAVYDAARPDYPDALFEDLARRTSVRPGDSLLEIGCGTGLATQGLARWNCRIVALDPGPELLRIARQRLAKFANIEWLQSSFEAWQATPAAFKLVVAAQSFHWLAPAERFSKIAAVLQPDGHLAVFGNVPRPFAAPLYEEVGQAYARHAPHLLKQAGETWYLPSGPISRLYEESGRFAPTTHYQYAWTRRYTASTYGALLSSVSSHQLLPAQQRDALLGAVTAAIAAHGGEFELPYETHLYVAQRLT